MAFDKLYIINRWMLAVGEKTLASLGTDSKSQRLANTIYDGIVEEVFDFDIPYKFATTRAELNQLTTTPAFGYSYQYALPENCVRILSTVDEDYEPKHYPYRREVLLTRTDDKVAQTDILACNQSSAFIRYIVMRTSPAVWPGYFRQLVILHGAMQMCAPVKKDDFRSMYLSRQFDRVYLMAKARNGAEELETADGGYTNLDLGNTDVIDANQDSERFETWLTEDNT